MPGIGSSVNSAVGLTTAQGGIQRLTPVQPTAEGITTSPAKWLTSREAGLEIAHGQAAVASLQHAVQGRPGSQLYERRVTPEGGSVQSIDLRLPRTLGVASTSEA